MGAGVAVGLVVGLGLTVVVGVGVATGFRVKDISVAEMPIDDWSVATICILDVLKFIDVDTFEFVVTVPKVTSAT